MDPQFAQAGLELARVYRLQGKYDLAWGQLDLLEGRPGVSRLAVKYERAMIYLWRDRADRYDEALVNLRDFSSSNRDEDYVLVDRGRRQLIALATQLGSDAMAVTPPTPESVDRAIEVLRLARDAVEPDPGIMGAARTSQIIVDFATAQLRKAGLTGEGRAAEFGCAAGMAQISLLLQAKDNFERALEIHASPDAFWGAGCAIRAINATPITGSSALALAIVSFDRAVVDDPNTTPANRVRNRLDQARALGAAQLWPEALRAFESALRLESREDRAARRAAIRVEIARLHLRNANIEAAVQRREDAVHRGLVGDELTNIALPGADITHALESLLAAIADDPDHANAYLLQGQISLFRREYRDARRDLNHALTRSAAPSERQRRTEADYYLSLSESWMEQDYLAARPPSGPRGNAAAAVLHADNASDANPQNAAYRKQACIARILFGNISDGRVYCTPDAANAADPAALLYEGMYFLRAAYRKNGAPQQSDWGRALARFQTGLDSLANSGPEAELIRARLAYGRRTVQYCLGAQSADPAALRDPAAAPHRRFFLISGISGCRPGR